jgi:hypothetical protein
MAERGKCRRQAERDVRRPLDAGYLPSREKPLGGCFALIATFVGLASAL